MKRGEGTGTIGGELRRYRKSRRLSGTALGKRLGLAKGTISKLETGALPVTLDFLARFCHELRLSADETKTLMQRASVLPATKRGNTDAAEFLSLLPFDFVSLDWAERSQRTVARWEENADSIEGFEPLAIPGLLQSEDYAEAALKASGVPTGKALTNALHARMKRQAILKSKKVFRFIISESALHVSPGHNTSRSETLRHIIALIERGSIELGIIPFSRPIPVFPPPAFYLFDQSRVYIELPHGHLFLNQATVTSVYSNLFQTLKDSAAFGEAAVSFLHGFLKPQQRSKK